jgi:hypothetical protein
MHKSKTKNLKGKKEHMLTINKCIINEVRNNPRNKITTSRVQPCLFVYIKLHQIQNQIHKQIKMNAKIPRRSGSIH